MRTGNLRFVGDNAKVAYSPDGEYVAAGGADGTIFLFRTAGGKLHSVLENANSSSRAVSMDVGMGIGSRAGARAEAGRLLAGHGAAVSAMAWGRDGLVSADQMGRVVLWQ